MITIKLQTHHARIPVCPWNRARLLDGRLAACHRSFWMTTSSFVVNLDTCGTTDTTVHHWQLSIPHCSGRNFVCVMKSLPAADSFKSQLKAYFSP